MSTLLILVNKRAMCLLSKSTLGLRAELFIFISSTHGPYHMGEITSQRLDSSSFQEE